MDFDHDPNPFIANIKQKIEDKEGIPIEKQILIFGGQQLDDNRCISDYNLEPEFIIHLARANVVTEQDKLSKKTMCVYCCPFDRFPQSRYDCWFFTVFTVFIVLQ